MEKCYEYYGCKRSDCKMAQNTDDIQCWELENTPCHSDTLGLLIKEGRRKEDICMVCTYYNLVTIGFINQSRVSTKAVQIIEEK